MFNNVLDREETFFGHKNFSLSKSQKSHFSKGVNYRMILVKKCTFPFFVFGQNKITNNVQ